ncbi:MAG: gas vesicle protein GvpD P-loop domain-containing protein [Thermoplasmata archaeon]
MRGMLPKEIRNFFRQNSGRSLLIKGAPGSGKTTLALQILEETVDINRGFYISTRVSDEAIFSQFKWLKEKEWRDRLIDITKDFLREIVPEKREIPEKKVVKAKEILSTLTGETEKRGVEYRTKLLSLIQEVEVPEIENLYDRIQSHLPSRCMVVIDSIDGLGEKYGIPYLKIVEALQKDLVEQTDVNLVVVVESEGQTPIDYLVDGIISLGMERYGMSQIREMSVQKMRGVKIENPYYLFTLLDGRFHTLEEGDKKEKAHKWTPIMHTVEKYSTGMKEVDHFIDEILPGEIIFIEGEPTVPETSMVPFILSPVANFLSQGHGVMLIPPVSMTLKHLSPVIQAANENVSNLRVFLKVHESSSEKHVVRLPYKNSMEDYQIWLENYNELLKQSKKPFLLAVGLDTQESAYRKEELMEVLMQVVEHARTKHDILLLATKLKGALNTPASAICKTHLRLQERNGLAFLTGQKKRTGTYWVRRVPREYVDDIELLPIL